MTDDLRPEDIDLAASEALDAARPDALPPEVQRRLRQFELTRATLRDDADAPSHEQIDQLVSRALLAADGSPVDSPGDSPPETVSAAPVSSLSERRARRLGRVAAVAAGVVVLAGAGWVLTREPVGEETAEDAATETYSVDPGTGAERPADVEEYVPPAADAPTSTAAPAAGAAPSTQPLPEAGGTEGSGTDGSSMDSDLSAGEQAPDASTWEVLVEWLLGTREG